MASKSEKQQLSGNNLLIVLALVTLLAIGITVLAAKAMIADVLLNNKVLTAKNLANANLKTDLDAAPKLVDAYNALGNQVGVLADALPGTADFPALIVEMENITNDSGILLKTVGPDTGLSAGGVVTAAAAPATAATGTSTTASASASGLNAPTPTAYNFNLDMGGSYNSVMKLLGDLETSARPMRVTSLSLSGTGAAVGVQMGVTTYYMDKAQLPIGKETVK